MCALKLEQKHKNVFHKWADILDEAHYKGVRQIKYITADDSGGRCALGVIRDYYGGPLPLTNPEDWDEYETCLNQDKMPLISVLNDRYGMNFHEIADFLRMI